MVPTEVYPETITWKDLNLQNIQKDSSLPNKELLMHLIWFSISEFIYNFLRIQLLDTEVHFNTLSPGKLALEAFLYMCATRWRVRLTHSPSLSNLLATTTPPAIFGESFQATWWAFRKCLIPIQQKCNFHLNGVMSIIRMSLPRFFSETDWNQPTSWIECI